MASSATKTIVRQVRDSNVAAEISLIQKFLQDYPYISMDTEFPGTVFKTIPLSDKLHSSSPLSPSDHYAAMKRNVDALCLIQLGLTLFDATGNLPKFQGFHCVWEFNFSDFDTDSDLHNPESISLLRSQGIDFSKNRELGINSRKFAVLFKLSGLNMHSNWWRNLTWITFHGMYDLGFMIKMLRGWKLPEEVGDFMALVRVFMGPNVYDVKPVAGAWGFHGGLERIASRLMVGRTVGRSHQAGSDSWLTMKVFVELNNKFGIQGFNYILYGLTCIINHHYHV